MLVSIAYARHRGYDKTTNVYSEEYKIVDSDFQEVIGVVGRVRRTWLGLTSFVALAVIDAYSKRKLPVASNLITAFQYWGNAYRLTMQQIIAYNKQYNPKYMQYADEVDKYLTLL